MSLIGLTENQISDCEQNSLSLSLFHTSDSILSAFKSVYVCLFTFSLKGGISIDKYIPLVCKIQHNKFETYECKTEKGQKEAR